MGRKHKHSKDKLYKTVSELDSHYVGLNRDLELSYLHRRLKFDSCCLCLNTIVNQPVGLLDDTQYCYVFDSLIVTKFVKKYPIHPVTGQKVSLKDLIRLRFFKNNQNEYHCPVTLKIFNQHSRIVANKRTGNVFSQEAYEQLNVKANHFKDLISDEPFTRADIVIIQDPSKAQEKWNVGQFHHVKHKLMLTLTNNLDDDDDDHELTPKSKSPSIEKSDIIKSSLEEYKRQEKLLNDKHKRLFGGASLSEEDNTEASSSNSKQQLDKINIANYSDGRLSKSVTSTVASITSSQAPAQLTDEQIIYPRIKNRKGYIRMITTLGDLNIELYCDRCPKTCHNFLQLTSQGYYNGTIFHRLIKDFMIQGGDPTGTGKGGQSIWGSPFKDEFHKDLKHEGPGVLAMANSGPNSNKSQFYITLRGSWDHLDGKHTIFGRVVGGYETLQSMNSKDVEVDKNDRPKQDIVLEDITKFQDPFEEAAKEVQLERDKQLEKEKDSQKRNKRKIMNAQGEYINEQDELTFKKFHSGIGGFIDIESIKDKMSLENSKEDRSLTSIVGKLDKNNKTNNKIKQQSNTTKKKSNFGDFSGW